MSGESGGMAITPLIGLGIAYPPLGILIAGGAIATSVVRAKRAERRRMEREAAREEQRRAREEQRLRNLEMNRNNQANVWNNTGTYNAPVNPIMRESLNTISNTMYANMNEQTILSKRASQEMNAELEKSRNEMLKVINNDDPAQYREYIGQLDKSKAEFTKRIYNIQNTFNENYHIKINESMAQISKEVDAQYTSQMNELQKLQADIQKKKETASSLAKDYIDEAKRLMTSLEEEYNGLKYSRNQMSEIERSINDAVAQYNAGNYEAAIAVAKDSMLATMEEIYKADCRQQEWENYYNMALTVSLELEGFIEGQETITAEAKAQVEQKIGKTIEDDIIGINVSDYTCKRSDGKNQYEYLLEQAKKIVATLESDEAENLSAEELKDYIDLINTKLYPAASKAIFDGILNMSNAFTRQNISEEIINFFEEHNFNFTGYSYDDDKHDGALRIGLENDTTGEEIIVTLAPELMQNGEVQTRVEIDQLKGDETNEERKEFFRQSVTDCVVESTPGAQIKLECKRETKNKLSEKTQLRDRLRQ